jgi:hypothetical protein
VSRTDATMGAVSTEEPLRLQSGGSSASWTVGKRFSRSRATASANPPRSVRARRLAWSEIDCLPPGSTATNSPNLRFERNGGTAGTSAGADTQSVGGGACLSQRTAESGVLLSGARGTAP